VKTPYLRAFLALLAGVTAFLVLASGAAAKGAPRVLAIDFDNDVNPVTADYVNSEIQKGNDDGYDAVAILLDTPGGLSDSMRKIYKKELASKIPVIVYVSPNGARAASAGVWISEAADLLAMAPSTNIGSSTPINEGGSNIGSDLRRKIVNDAAASLTSLARYHKRNTAWPQLAVRKASNLPSYVALNKNVIDFTAPSLPALLSKTNGYRTKSTDGQRSFVLHLRGAQIHTVHMSLWQRILDTLIDPNIIVLLLSVGTLGIIVELWAPGHIFPGTVGAISLILALFGLSVLPISWAGILLMVLAFAFFAAEPFVMSHGALTAAAIVSFVFGALLLFEPAGSAYQVSLPVVLAIAGVLGALLFFVVMKIVQVRRRPPTVGVHTIVGERGVVRRDGYVFVRGELWRAHGDEGTAMLWPGQEIEVTGVEEGLALSVRPVAGDDIGSGNRPPERTADGSRTHRSRRYRDRRSDLPVRRDQGRA
jgi:membrane-bound serine protease (ClpP class)